MAMMAFKYNCTCTTEEIACNALADSLLKDSVLCQKLVH